MKKTIAIFILTLLIISCNKSKKNNHINFEAEKANVEKAIKNTIAWAKDKDTSLLYSIIANEKNYLEVHPENNVVKGINQFKEAENF